MPFGRKKTTGSRPRRSFTGSSAASRRRCWRSRTSTGPSWSTTSSSRRRIPGTKGVARFRYPDRSGKTRVFDWALDGQEGKSVALPESDLTVTLSEATEFPTTSTGLERDPGRRSDSDRRVQDPVGQGRAGHSHGAGQLADGSQRDSVRRTSPRKPRRVRWRRSTTWWRPRSTPRLNGRFGQIEVLAGPDEALYYRVFGRGKESKGELRAAGPLAKDKPIVAFGGNANMPMTITFQVDQYLPSAIEKSIYEPIVLPKGQMGNGIAACRAEMTVDGQTKEVWVSRSVDLDPPAPQTVTFRDSVYQVIYDVDRKPLGFELKLDDFDTGFEPGTEQATHFESKVRLTDKSAGIKDQPHTIWMNHPLDHRGYTFYQSNYIRVRDPHTGQFTGQFQSVFQVATNPGRPIIYGGCLLVVLGAFLQFYMRAGIFTDGGKRERERAAIAAKKKAELGMKTEEL